MDEQPRQPAPQIPGHLTVVAAHGTLSVTCPVDRSAHVWRHNEVEGHERFVAFLGEHAACAARSVTLEHSA